MNITGVMVYQPSGLFGLNSCNQHLHGDQRTENQSFLSTVFCQLKAGLMDERGLSKEVIPFNLLVFALASTFRALANEVSILDSFFVL